MKDELLLWGSIAVSIWLASLLPVPFVLKLFLGFPIWLACVHLLDALFGTARRNERERQRQEREKRLLEARRAIEYLPYARPGLGAEEEWALWESCLRNRRRRRSRTL